MNGAESLVRVAVAAGVEVCFANPGTSEMPLVAALDSVPGMRAVLGLFEGVLSGAADGYGRMAERPAVTLFHLGPGFANAIANLHNARRAKSPVVNLVGDHTTWHRHHDPPLASDVESLARPVSGWYRESASAIDLSRDMAEAIAAAAKSPGQVATLAVPTDCQWDPADEVASVQAATPPETVGQAALEEARASLLGDGGRMLLLGGLGVRGRGLRAAGRIAAATGCRLAVETFFSRLERGPGLPTLERVPYFPEQRDSFFRGVTEVVLAGASDPVAFFGYPAGISRLVPEEVSVKTLATADQDVEQALEDLVTALAASLQVPSGSDLSPPPRPSGALNAQSIAQAVASLQPEGAIVVDEGVTAAGAYLPLSAGCPPHTVLSLTGGAIGWGLPCATGAALACPDRKVITLEGDGSGLYTVQALWTQAREGLDVVNLVFANDLYRILQIELHRAGIDQPGPQSRSLTDLGQPAIGWCDLATSFGVPASRAETAEDLVGQLEVALAEPGPRVIEVRAP